MSVVIYGGDRLGKIPLLLKENGFHLVRHIKGRKKGELKMEIPQEAQGVLVLIDYIARRARGNHNLALDKKAAAKRKGIRAIFVKRSWAHIKLSLEALKQR